MKNTLFLCAFLLFGISKSAQDKLDSLWNIWNQETLNDTTRLNAIGKVSEAIVRNQPDSTLVVTQMMLDLATEKGLKKYQADALFLQGRSYSYLGKLDEHCRQKDRTYCSAVSRLAAR